MKKSILIILLVLVSLFSISAVALDCDPGAGCTIDDDCGAGNCFIPPNSIGVLNGQPGTCQCPPLLCTDPPDNMISWWTGDVDATDFLELNDGTLTGSATAGVAGKVNNAFNFPGSGDVSILSSTSLDIANAITVDAWIKPVFAERPRTGVTDTDVIYSLDIGNANHGQHQLSILMDPVVFGVPFGTPQVALIISGASTVLTGSVPVPNDGKFHHVAYTYDDSIIRLYLDGTQTDTFSTSGTMDTGNSGAFIGHRLLTPLDSLADIDEVELFDRALSGAEILAIFNADSAGKCQCSAPPANMISWWPGDGDASDIWDSNPGTLKNGATFTTGIVGQAFNLDGVDDYVTANGPNLNMGSGDFTLDTWFKTTSEASGAHDIVIKGGFGPGGKNYALLMLNGDLVGAIDDNTVVKSVTASTIVTDDVWHHAALVRDGNNLRLYVDGVEDSNSPADITGYGNIDSSDPLIIGAGTKFSNSQVENFFEGEIDEVEVFGRALSDAEILAIFDSGSAGKCRPECGNGILEANEKCDDGIDNSDTEPNACRTDCTLPFCGDRVVDDQFGEDCENDGDCLEDQFCRGDCLCIGNPPLGQGRSIAPDVLALTYHIPIVQEEIGSVQPSSSFTPTAQAIVESVSGEDTLIVSILIGAIGMFFIIVLL